MPREDGSTRLAGKVAVVTGATSGFGDAIARLFAREGASVVAHGRNRAAGEALVRELGGDACFVAGDVGEPADAQALADAARERFGRVDALVLNAGIVRDMAPFWEVTLEDFDDTMRTNVRGAWLCARACTPLIGRGGSIVLMGSIGSVIAGRGVSAYAVSKGAVLQLARSMAVDLAERGVRVNAVCPGPCDTPLMHRHLDGPGSTTPPAAVVAQIPLGRVGSAEEIARATLFFASADSSFCTGASLLADGGYTAL